MRGNVGTLDPISGQPDVPHIVQDSAGWMHDGHTSPREVLVSGGRATDLADLQVPRLAAVLILNVRMPQRTAAPGVLAALATTLGFINILCASGLVWSIQNGVSGPPRPAGWPRKLLMSRMKQNQRPQSQEFGRPWEKCRMDPLKPLGLAVPLVDPVDQPEAKPQQSKRSDAWRHKNACDSWKALITTIDSAT